MAKKAESKLDLLAVYRQKAELRERRLNLEKEAKELGNEEKLLEQALIAQIPVGAVIQGVKHTVSVKKTPKWGEILPILKERFIPKTKWTEAAVVIDDHSTESTTHRFDSEL